MAFTIPTITISKDFISVFSEEKHEEDIKQDGSFKDFTTGEQFIAKDYLPSDMTFDSDIHGHSAEVIGSKDLEAVHIKLGKAPLL